MTFDSDKFITRFGGWTESYFFYDGQVELRYDPKKHVYLLVNGLELEPQAGVTSVCHIIDKSEALIPWACKMMAQKIMNTVPLEPPRAFYDPNGLNSFTKRLSYFEFERVVNEAKTAHKDHLDDAGAVGHMAHTWIEKYIKLLIAKDMESALKLRDNLPPDPRAHRCCLAALSWMERHEVRWVCTERKIYSFRHKYAGTLDGLCYISSCDDPSCCPHPFTDRLSVVDWKTSNFLYPEYLLQTAAYEQAYEEEMSVDIQNRWVIRLGKDDAEFETWHMESDDFGQDFYLFLVALDLYRGIDDLKNRIKYRIDTRRSADKSRLAAERAEALKFRCAKADKYKGVRKPVCNGGNPCVSCLNKYAERHPVKEAVCA